MTGAVTPTISVVIPVRDDAAALEGCLAALRDQTRPPDEVVVVDNSAGGDPATAQVAAAAGARLVHEPRRGVGAASATGYDAATGEILGRLDADSRPGPEWVETVLALLTDERLHAITGPGRFYDIPGRRGRIAAAAYHWPLVLGVGAAMGHPPLWGSTMAVRRDAWERCRHLVHREDPLVHDDLDLAFALGPRARVRWTKALAVGVEGRAFHSRAAMVSRVRRTLHTCRLHWARQPAGHRLVCSLSRGRWLCETAVTPVE